MGLPTTSERASSRVWRIRSPPGTSPTPVRPALSVRITILRVKNGPWAPLRLSSMLSWPATGMTCRPVTTGAPLAWCWCSVFIGYSLFAQDGCGLQHAAGGRRGQCPGEKHQDRRQDRSARQAIQTALDRTGGLFQETKGGGRDKPAEVADGVDQRDHRRGDAGIQVA